MVKDQQEQVLLKSMSSIYKSGARIPNQCLKRGEIMAVRRDDHYLQELFLF